MNDLLRKIANILLDSIACVDMKICSVILLAGISAFAFSGCAKHPEWHRTNQDYYIYGILPDDSSISWDGPLVGHLPNGKGNIKIYDEDNQLVEEINCVSLKFGVMPDYSFVPVSRNRKFAGKIKKGNPEGFGVLLSGDTLSVGIFKKGVLYSGPVEQYVVKEKGYSPLMVGAMKKSKLQGPVKLYNNGVVRYDGLVKRGKYNGLGMEYVDGVLCYSGEWKKGVRNGVGKEFENGVLLYDGEWKNGYRHGHGTLYKNGSFPIYEGQWKNGRYNGKGKLYENGICQVGKWEDGVLVNSISKSTFSEMVQASKHWFSPDSTYALSGSLSDNISEIPSSQSEFIELLNVELDEYLHSEFSSRVEKRFGFWNLLRMVCQPWFTSDVGRASAAQKYFCKNVKSSELQNWINAKIDNFNEYHADKLRPVTLDELAIGSIVDDTAALKVFEREAIETTDTMVGILVDVVLCLIVAFIIGFIVGCFIPLLVPYLGIVDTLMGLISFGIGIYLSMFRTVPMAISLENEITDMLVNNYMLFLNSQDIVSQMFGLL